VEALGSTHQYSNGAGKFGRYTQVCCLSTRNRVNIQIPAVHLPILGGSTASSLFIFPHKTWIVKLCPINCYELEVGGNMKNLGEKINCPIRDPQAAFNYGHHGHEAKNSIEIRVNSVTHLH